MKLGHCAHPAYAKGLADTGISGDRIPRIAEMNERLARFGWGAVSVDGFIPPRAFQEFQACGILPIAADIRSREHLEYTPAPDIIHEAAGHAPILPDPVYSAYLRRIGSLGRRAFTRPAEAAVDRAIRTLSRVKEDPAARPESVAQAEADLNEARSSAGPASEATRLSRLYWWTAEYGLVGRTDAYSIYGAGLLSSLGESQSCHASAVRKIVFDERCVDVSYDITRPQPQLFVARDFEALHEVLDKVAPTLGFARGGQAALAAALESEELASVQFSSGLWVLGVLRDVRPGLSEPAWLGFEGGVAFVVDDELWPATATVRPASHGVFTGPLDDGTALEHATEGAIGRRLDTSTGRHRFRFASGALVEGVLAHVRRRKDGRVAAVELRQARLFRPGQVPLDVDEYSLLAVGDLITAQAGAVDANYYGDAPFSWLRFPKPRVRALAPRIARIPRTRPTG